jgi:nucleotide-binding universal stress UspA family protein
MAGTRRIVVGVDGSEGARKALRWAVEEADAHDATVEAVHVWQLPMITPGLGAPMVALDPSDFQRGAAEQLDEALHDALGETISDRVERVVVEGYPASVLLDRSEKADLLVVGSRGRGGFAGLLLGSVSQQCVHHAKCPVVVIHA